MEKNNIKHNYFHNCFAPSVKPNTLICPETDIPQCMQTIVLRREGTRYDRRCRIIYSGNVVIIRQHL